MRTTSRRAVALALLIGAYSVALATMWLVRVPLFQEPDELTHFDYAAALFDTGHPFIDRSLRPAHVVTPEADYLARRARYRQTRYDIRARFGGRAALSALAAADRSAPTRSGATPAPGSPFPAIAFSYPMGAYVLTAIVMTVAYAASGSSLVAAFFAARALGVVCLAVNLCLTWKLLRSYSVRYPDALWTLLAIGALPLTSWVSGYVQPDNVSAVACTAALLAARHWQRHPVSFARALTAGALVAATSLVKQQYGFTMIVAIGSSAFAAAASKTGDPVRRYALAASAPVIGLVGLALSFFATPVGRLAAAQNLLGAEAHDSSRHFDAGGFAAGLLATLSEVLFGEGRRTFWFSFGFNRETLLPPELVTWLYAPSIVLACATSTTVVLAEFALFWSLIAIARRRSWRTAASLAAGAAPFVAYLVLSSILVVLSATSDGLFWLDGRYWLPVLPGLALAVVIVVPRLVRPPLRRKLRTLLASAAGVGSLTASAFGWNAIDRAFYDSPEPGPVIASRAALESYVSTGGKQGVDWDSVPAGRTMEARGFAIDGRTGTSAEAVACGIDGRPVPVRSGLPSARLVKIMNDELVARAGFETTVPGSLLERGPHRLTCEVVGTGPPAPFERDVALRAR